MHDGTFGRFKTSRRERIDIRVGVERRRRWSREEKLRIVRESLEPNAVVIEVARRNEVSASLIYMWRRQALAGLMEGFQRVEVIADAPPMIEADAPAASALLPQTRDSKVQSARDIPDAHVPTVPAEAAQAPRPTIEVTLPCGAVVRVDGAVDAKALRTVLGVLAR